MGRRKVKIQKEKRKFNSTEESRNLAIKGRIIEIQWA